VNIPLLLKKLEEAFPDSYPAFRDYSPELILKNIGNQEVIRLIRRIHEDGGN
jgi:hypothetical protein